MNVVSKQKNKIKNWYEEHKEGLKITAALLAGCAAVGCSWHLGEKWAELKIGCGLESVHNKGVIKFFNPETNQELDIDGANKYLRENVWNNKN